jgi:hypothetical protein
MIHFALKEFGELEFESHGEATEKKVMEWGYPSLDDVWAEAQTEAAGKTNVRM